MIDIEFTALFRQQDAPNHVVAQLKDRGDPWPAELKKGTNRDRSTWPILRRVLLI